MPSLYIVIRTFEAKASPATFNEQKFLNDVVIPLKMLLFNKPDYLKRIAIVTRGDDENNNSEYLINETPTSLFFIHKYFENEIRNKIIIPVIHKEWGNNAGSATAVNCGLDALKPESDFSDGDQALIWSTEFSLNWDKINEMRDAMNKLELKLVGYLRKDWETNLPWAFAQNTCAIWDLKLLKDIGYFSADCDGSDKKTVSIELPGEKQSNVSLAGMDDFHAYLRASESNKPLHWGMVGHKTPSEVNVSNKENEAQKAHIIKIARQLAVMEAYAKAIKPNGTVTFKELCQKIWGEAFHADESIKNGVNFLIEKIP